MIEHFRAGNQDSYSEINRAIHDAIFDIARNQALSDTYNMVQTRLRSIFFVTPKVPPQWADAVADHEEMILALEGRDGVRFAEIARRHLCHKADAMRVALDTLAGRTDAKHSRTRLAVG